MQPRFHGAGRYTDDFCDFFQRKILNEWSGNAERCGNGSCSSAFMNWASCSCRISSSPDRLQAPADSDEFLHGRVLAIRLRQR